MELAIVIWVTDKPLSSNARCRTFKIIPTEIEKKGDYRATAKREELSLRQFSVEQSFYGYAFPRQKGGKERGIITSAVPLVSVGF